MTDLKETAQLKSQDVWQLPISQTPPLKALKKSVVAINKRLLQSPLIRRRYRSYITSIEKQDGHCFCFRVPAYLISDQGSESRLMIFEDDRPLSFPHAKHDEIANMGAGRFSHWGTFLLFSTSDNSDPRTNGRVYSVREL